MNLHKIVLYSCDTRLLACFLKDVLCLEQGPLESQLSYRFNDFTFVVSELKVGGEFMCEQGLDFSFLMDSELALEEAMRRLEFFIFRQDEKSPCQNSLSVTSDTAFEFVDWDQRRWAFHS